LLSGLGFEELESEDDFEEESESPFEPSDEPEGPFFFLP
jgi:hypothetical protein